MSAWADGVRRRVGIDPAAWPFERWAAYLILFAVAFGSRLYGLGARAMSHDESMHAWYSWAYAGPGGYAHDPMLHGPLLFHMNAIVFRLLGDNDATARLLPALAGVGVVAGLLAFQRWLGRTAAFLAAALAALSPTLLFYSRYIRNDVYMALFALAWVYGIFRYLEAPRWTWLALVSLAMALSFACKETVFITGLIFGGWLGALALARALRPRPSASPHGEAASGPPPEPAPPDWGPAADLAVFMLTVALPFASALGLQACGWDPCDWKTPLGQRRALGMQTVFAAAGAAGAWAWLRFRDRAQGRPTRPPALWWAACAAGFWLVQIVLYTSVFTNVRQGAVSGVSGALGYWLAQHGVQRAGQPWFYYLMLAALYEFLPLILSAAAAGRFFVLRREQPPLPVRFCAAWALASVVAYSLAGEKMPWLLTHITLPLCLLGAAWGGGFLDRCRADPARRGAALAMAACVPVAFYALVNLPGGEPFAGRTLAGVRASMRFLRALAAVVLLAWLAWRYAPRLTAAGQRRWAGAGALALLALLTAHAAYRLAFVNYDLPVEPLVYAHGTPHVKRIARRADDLRRAQAATNGPVVACDEDCTWPFAWYFRRTPHTRFTGSAGAPIPTAPLILCGDAALAAVREVAGTNYVEETAPALWWPQEVYKRGLLASARALLADPAQRRRLWRAAAYRDYPGSTFSAWPLRRNVHLLTRREWASAQETEEPDGAEYGFDSTD